MDRHDVKRRKEEFVSNLAGTSKWEIFCAIGCLPLCLLFAAAAEHWLMSRLKTAGFRTSTIRLASFLTEFALVVLPQVAICMSDTPAVIPFLMLLCVWAMVATKLWQKAALSAAAKQHLQQQLQMLAEPRKRFLSAFRGGVMLYTCLGILAVDFRAFPRRYAKAETFGQGLMDVGVGAIVYASGVSSKAANREGGRAPPLSRRAALAARTASPLLLLGLGRLAATTAAGYQHHVGEYGTHWNFFFTAAAVGALTQLAWVPEHLLAPAGVAVTALHQAALSLTPLGAWVQSEERGPGLLAGNKEGLVSLWGYWALHLLGAATGSLLRGSCSAAVARARGALQHGKGQAAQAADAAVTLWAWVGRLAVVDAALWAASWAAEQWAEPVSRRACNMAYVSWMAALCLSTVLLCLATELLLVPQAPGRSPVQPLTLPGAVNRSMLALFLVANLATGGVNLSINTLEVDAWPARGVVGGYMFVVCALAWALDAADITLKFW